MPLNQQQLLAGANYQLETYATGDPVDNIDKNRPFAKWLIAHKAPSIFSNGIFNEKVRISNDSNYQNYSGDDQVTYNRRDTVRKAPFQHYEAHDGFSLNETDLANNGIVMTDDKNAVMTDAEHSQIVNILKENWAVLKEGMQTQWDLEVHLDGTASPKAVPGLDLLVSTTPAVGTIGGLDAATMPFWRNNASLNISTATAGDLVEEMEIMWRACMTYGSRIPSAIFCGSKFYDALRKDARAVNDIMVNNPMTGGVTLDPSTKELRFKGVVVVWDPTFDALDEQLGAISVPWAKRCYFLNDKTFKLRPFKGRWMINRKPSRIYDRYTHYFATTTDYGLTVSQRNDKAVLSIA